MTRPGEPEDVVRMTQHSPPSCSRCGGELGPPIVWTWTVDHRVLCVDCAHPRAPQFGARP